MLDIIIVYLRIFPIHVENGLCKDPRDFVAKFLLALYTLCNKVSRN